MRIWGKIKKNLRKYQHLFWNPINRITFFMNDVTCGKGLKSSGKVYVLNDDGTIEIGDDVMLNSGDWTNPIGCGNRIWLQVRKGARLSIGSHSGISNTAITCQSEITIGNNVFIGSGCRIYDTDFHSLKVEERRQNIKARCKPVKISDNVFLGSGVTVLKGVCIGEGSVVGANAVVTKDIPAHQIWAGNPARYIRNCEQYN